MPVTTELTGTVIKSVPTNEYRQGHIYVEAEAATFWIAASQIKSRAWPQVGDMVRFKAAPHRPGFAAEIVRVSPLAWPEPTTVQP